MVTSLRRILFLIILVIACTSLVISLCAQPLNSPKNALNTASLLAWSDLDSAILILNNTLSKAEAYEDQGIIADVSLALSKTYNHRRECDSISRWCDRAAEIYDRLSNRRGQAEVLFQRGFEFFCRTDYEIAMEHVLHGLQIMEDLNDDAGIALGHLRMSRIFHFTFKMAQSAAYGRLAAPKFEDNQDYINAWDSWSFAGHGYRMENDSLQAIECFDKGLSMARRSGVPAVEGMAYNDLASFYMEFDAYDSAAVYFQKALDLADPGDQRQIMVTKNGLGQVYLHTGQYQKCIDLLSEALAVIKKTNEVFFMTEVPEYIAQSYAALGQYDSAYKYMEMNWRFSDSLFTQNQDKALEEMKTKYESDRKDQVIDRQRSERKYGLALMISASILAFMFYRRYVAKKRTNTILDKSNKEKDYLLKEIHHRVKNNLQILSSLLNLQADYIKDENALNAITEGRNRVQSMSFIHQQLYSEDNVTAVNMKAYLADLCGHLSDSFTSEQKIIDINYDIQIDSFDVETAIPLGLIVNELITNSIKYAFVDRDRGVISVKLWQNDNDQLCLLVSDDGHGGSATNAVPKGTSFGTDLIKILSQKLKGKIETDTVGGFSTLITFDRYRLISAV